MPLRNEYMTIFNVTKAVKQHAGEYRCVADNLIGKPASATFQIRILCTRLFIHKLYFIKMPVFRYCQVKFFRFVFKKKYKFLNFNSFRLSGSKYRKKLGT